MFHWFRKEKPLTPPIKIITQEDYEEIMEYLDNLEKRIEELEKKTKFMFDPFGGLGR